MFLHRRKRKRRVDKRLRRGKTLGKKGEGTYWHDESEVKIKTTSFGEEQSQVSSRMSSKKAFGSVGKIERGVDAKRRKPTKVRKEQFNYKLTTRVLQRSRRGGLTEDAGS